MKFAIRGILIVISLAIVIIFIVALAKPIIDYPLSFVKMKMAEKDIMKNIDKIISGELKDPWGNKYIYIKPGVHNKNGFDIYSRGKNGIGDGTDIDDINNWDKNKSWRKYY